MKVLIVGSGGREHALAWKITQSPDVDAVFAAPGNAGISRLATCVPVKAANTQGILSLCEKEGIDLVVVGPETPLIAGQGDALRARGIPVFGPNADGARIEGSKVFAKELFRDYHIPSARFEAYEDPDAAEKAARAWSGPLVVKADGEAAGKGVLMCETPDDAVNAVRLIMRDRAFGTAGDRVVLEERLSGPEVSVFALCDGKTVLPFQPAQDYKRAGEGDTGLNTGGMGAVSPVPLVTPAMMEAATTEVLVPTVKALSDKGIDYRGLLYAGLMWTQDGWKLLEYNCRFGDPETQVLLPRLKSDLFPLLMACALGDLDAHTLDWSTDVAASVVLASEGYPGAYETGRIIRGLRLAEELPGVTVFHAGTKFNDQKLVATSGGRVLNVTATGPDFETAMARVYEAVEAIDYSGKQFRRDIGRNMMRK